ncbi:polysaccharide pyruvyl transferase family protein [Raineyella fluvialis]|uniref:Polysaccharide pyruvyl transferase domain-containing protein n=1 Tax=Raineyella fluvialis TaxID=2662261 RepID=A0A5Q2FGH3_9ACTN|nr:polysaccharide pyruvyl transferase family protein [Raineyella fluvialis]QGF23406.1 hypothetical protein Rai3103_06705 [Raineyella fluvialis]
MKAFLCGSYKWANKGDAALVVSLIAWLRRLDVNATGMTSFDPVGDQTHYDIPVHAMPVRPPGRYRLFAEGLLSRSQLARRMLARCRMLVAWGWFVYFPYWGRLYVRHPWVARVFSTRSTWVLAKEMRGSDVVIGVPGGYIQAPRLIDDWWLLHLPGFLLAKGMGKPVILSPCSVGPFDSAHLALAKRFLMSLDLIAVREDYTVLLLEGLGISEDRLSRSPDMAFLFDRQDIGAFGQLALASLEKYAVEHSGLVGVSVREHSFPGSVNPQARMDAYLAECAFALRRLHDAGAGIVLIHQTEEDARVTSELGRLLQQEHVPCIVLDPRLEPWDLRQVYRKLDMLIGTRMHANILAMGAGTPVVGIGYEHKTMGILARLGLDEWGLWIDQVVDGDLWPLVQRCWNARAANCSLLPSVLKSVDDEFDRVGREIARVVKG